MKGIHCVSALIMSVIVSLPVQSQNQPSTRLPSEIVEPNLTYGYDDTLPLPKTVLFSASPDEIVADAEEWSRRGINAFFMNYVAREWSSDIWAKDDKPWTIGESDHRFGNLPQGRLRSSVRVVQRNGVAEDQP